MKVELSIHAQIRSRERGISFDKIKQVISKPSQYFQEGNGRIKVKKEIDGRLITVIYTEVNKKIIIVTVI